jgi:N-formylglutamate amidohydrolase
VLREVEDLARSEGLTLRHDDPYRGGWTTGHWGRPPDGIQAVQIELSRALYLDEATLEPSEAGIARLSALAARLCARFGVVL